MLVSLVGFARFRLVGRARLLSNIALPPKPQEPGPEDCCQNGCPTCVWEVYADELAQWRANVACLEALHGAGGEEGVAKQPAQWSPESAGFAAFQALEEQLKQQQQRRADADSNAKG